MKKTVMTAFALGIGLAAMAAMPGAAEAGGGRNWHGWNGWNQFHGGHFIERRHHRRYGVRHFGGGNCRFYLRKARRTGKSHWWKKYQWCARGRRY